MAHRVFTRCAFFCPGDGAPVRRPAPDRGNGKPRWAGIPGKRAAGRAERQGQTWTGRGGATRRLENPPGGRKRRSGGLATERKREATNGGTGEEGRRLPGNGCPGGSEKDGAVHRRGARVSVQQLTGKDGPEAEPENRESPAALKPQGFCCLVDDTGFEPQKVRNYVSFLRKTLFLRSETIRFDTNQSSCFIRDQWRKGQNKGQNFCKMVRSVRRSL